MRDPSEKHQISASGTQGGGSKRGAVGGWTDRVVSIFTPLILAFFFILEIFR